MENSGTDDEDATEFGYLACAYACVALENQALSTGLISNIYVLLLHQRGTTSFSFRNVTCQNMLRRH